MPTIKIEKSNVVIVQTLRRDFVDKGIRITEKKLLSDILILANYYKNKINIDRIKRSTADDYELLDNPTIRNILDTHRFETSNLLNAFINDEKFIGIMEWVSSFYIKGYNDITLLVRLCELNQEREMIKKVKEI